MNPKIKIEGNVSEREINEILQSEQKKAKGQGLLVTELEIKEINAEELEIKVKTSPPISRVRRITGYLAGTDRFNNAKLQELKDRVVHT